MVETRIPIRWRDLDGYAHVHNSVYVVYLDEARDEWLRTVLGGDARTEGFVAARVAVEYRGELRLGHREIVCRSWATSLDGDAVVLRHELRRADGEVAAEGESVVVAWEPGAEAPHPLEPAERAAFERALS